MRLIDADALILELEEWKKNPNNDDSSVDMVNHFIGIIKAQPSAEQVTSKLKNPCDSLLTADSEDAKENKSKLEPAEAVQGWIPATESFPSESGRYLVTYFVLQRHKLVDIMHFGKPSMPNVKVKGECWYRVDDEWGDVVYNDILAWMPLPKPYREDREDHELATEGACEIHFK